MPHTHPFDTGAYIHTPRPIGRGNIPHSDLARGAGREARRAPRVLDEGDKEHDEDDAPGPAGPAQAGERGAGGRTGGQKGPPALYSMKATKNMMKTTRRGPQTLATGLGDCLPARSVASRLKAARSASECLFETVEGGSGGLRVSR